MKDVLDPQSKKEITAALQTNEGYDGYRIAYWEGYKQWVPERWNGHSWSCQFKTLRVDKTRINRGRKSYITEMIRYAKMQPAANYCIRQIEHEANWR